MEKRLPQLSIFDLFKFLSSNIRKILYVGICAVVIFSIYSLTLNNEYSSESTLIPESIDGAPDMLSGFEGVAGLAGIQLPSSEGSSLNPELFKEIISSNQFIDSLIIQPISIDEYPNINTIGKFVYYENEPGGISTLIRKTWSLIFSKAPYKDIIDNPETLNKDKKDFYSEVSNTYSISYDKKKNIVDIKSTVSNPYVAKLITVFAIDYLKQYSLRYKNAKHLERLNFIRERLAVKEREFTQAQEALSDFEDSNFGNLTRKTEIIRENLQNKYDLSFNVYQGLLQQYEDYLIKVADNSYAVFTTIVEPKIDYVKSGPRRSLIVIGMSFLTLIFYILFLILSNINSFISED